MQEIIYETPYGETVNINPYRPPFVLDTIKGVGAASAQVIVHNPAGLDGALYQTLVLDDREITVNLHIHGANLEDAYAQRIELNRLCSSAASKGGRLGILHYINNHGRWWIPATVKQGPKENGKRLQNYLPVQVVFYCPDPLWRAAEATMNSLAYSNAGFKFPLMIPAITESNPGVQFGLRGYQATITNEGDSPTPLEVTIQGPAIRPLITHKGTGEYIGVSKELFVGDELYINTLSGHKEVKINRGTGEVESAMGYIDPSSTFFQLRPGENPLEYNSGDDTTSAAVLIRAWSRYGGV